MNPWTKRLEIAVNVAILCAFTMVAVLAGQRIWGGRAIVSGSEPQIGARIVLSGADWSKSDRHLILALSTTCHFCSESAAFYKRLLTDVAGHGVHVIAVLPQPPTASRTYLNGLGLSIPEVVQSPLISVDVTGTPTLLLVDAKGKIRKAWVGKLEPEREDEVIATLR
jgi:hypothetical protein